MVLLLLFQIRNSFLSFWAALTPPLAKSVSLRTKGNFDFAQTHESKNKKPPGFQAVFCFGSTIQ
jgi:hypothetical protein